MPASLSRSAAAKASLAAKGGLVVAGLAVAGVVMSLPDIPTPHYDGVDPDPPASEGPAASVRPVNFSTMSRSLTLAGEFPPPEEVPDQVDPDGGFEPAPPSAPGTPDVKFLGAIAEPGRFVALLNINGKQKFLGPGESYGQVRVVECSATEVVVQFQDSSGTPGGRETIGVSERSGPGWTAAAPSPEPDPNMVMSGEAPPDGAGMPGFPGMPPGFTPPDGMTPEQIQMMQREIEAARQMRGRDGSQ
jgi:hypothetical protein